MSGIRVAARYSPCSGNDENSREKVQNVCGDSSAVRDRRLAEAEQGANLRAVVFDGAAVPGILWPPLVRYAHLLRHVFHHGRGHFPGVAWETSHELEKFEENGETEPCRPGLVADQTMLGCLKRPME